LQTIELQPVSLPSEPGGTDILVYYADFGLPYREHIERLAASARRILPEARLVLLTPTPDKVPDVFDATVVMDAMPPGEKLMLYRIWAQICWLVATNRKTIVCDVDLEFLRKPVFDGSFDIGLLWRTNKPDQPINTGLTLVGPGQRRFWEHQARVAANLPLICHSWWADQLSLCLMTGICHKAGDMLDIDGSRVRLFDASECCDVAKDIKENAWALHYKGARKGGWFKDIYESGRTPSDGTSLPASALSMGIAPVPNSASPPAALPYFSAG
jgi:hypothetical protein